MRRGDFIYVKNLLVKATTGLDDWQRAISQPLKIAIGINVGNRLRRMALTDDIRRTLNYDSISTLIIRNIERNSHENIDSTAESVLKSIQPYLAPGEFANVNITQPKARLLTQAREIEFLTNDSTKIKEKLIGLHAPTTIGINDLERVCKQEIRLNIMVVRKAHAEVFTHDFTSQIAEFVQSSQFLTIESFVNVLAEFVYKWNKEDIYEVTVDAAKPSALNMADCAGVRVTRTPMDFKIQENHSSAPKNEEDNVVYIAFGTNQGNKLDNINRSIDELKQRGIAVEKTSAIYQSEPMYVTDQPRFFNGMFKCRTQLDPNTLLKALKDIEYNVFNRVKKFDNGPRPLDLDIILFNNEFIESEILTVPHKDMLNRSFVLRPLNDLLPADNRWNYNEAANGGESVIVPLFKKNGASTMQSYLEFHPEHPHSQPTMLMSILNATPDSFSDGGELNKNNVQQLATWHIKAGGSILDVGGYSTRPGAGDVSIYEESQRVCSAIKQIRKLDKNVVISVDTFRASVAKDALECGANLINDVFSGTVDPAIFNLANSTGAPIILSHSRGTPQTMKELINYPTGLLNEVAVELRERIDAALKAGCKPWQIILDPGLGFSKTPQQDLEIVKRFKELKHHPVLTDGLPVLPWLVGPSRKSFIGHYTNTETPKSRLPGTIAVITALRQQGADIIRVHDTSEANQAILMADQIYK